MRLVDADALKDKAFGGRKGLVHSSDIDAAPTIDAIPVEWLRDVLEEAKEFPRVEHETIAAIPYLIHRWHQEQEAR